MKAIPLVPENFGRAHTLHELTISRDSLENVLKICFVLQKQTKW